ncbi:MAG: hypothetical protein LUH58_00805 [Lachnospiraceae bacterium]|nr:hypothetical protein [Lachnospiraceae bacterium]
MEREFYVDYYRDFGNTYNLYYADTPEMRPLCGEKISKERAMELIRQECWARRNDHSFSGCADAEIYPGGYFNDDWIMGAGGYIDRKYRREIAKDENYKLINYIWERVR